MCLVQDLGRVEDMAWRREGSISRPGPSGVVFALPAPSRVRSTGRGNLRGMPDPTVARLHEWLRTHEQELLADTVRLLRIPSIKAEPGRGAPFGLDVRRALDLALSIGDAWGMATADLEGFAGYAEFGAGERQVISLGHLDVVPVGQGWKHEPFGAEIDCGYIYARGSTDDKGPTMASFYAARAIQECVPDVPSRSRVVFGCNEESGMECVKRYAETEGPPTFGVAPDSGWPLYHAEKGIANLKIEITPPSGAFRLVAIDGGQRPNIVVDECQASVRVDESVRTEIDGKLADLWDRNVEWSWDGSDTLRIRAIGKAAHGAHPFAGDSAATRAFRVLASLAPLEFEKFYEDLLETTHISGVGLGIHGADDASKDLTSNLGIVSTTGETMHLLFNVRYPVTWKFGQLRARCEAHLAELHGDFRLAGFDDSPALYFPLEHPLVEAVCDVYREETGDDRKPGVMGGGTYARMIPNTVSIGTGWDGDGKAHETDERLAVESLFKMSRIYAHILYRLATMPATNK